MKEQKYSQWRYKESMKSFAIHVLLVLVISALIFLMLAYIVGSIYGQDQSKQTETLNGISFDKVVLITLIALEKNYQAKERLCPDVHQTDYYTVILNTAKRQALNEVKKLNRDLARDAVADSSKTNK